MRIWRNWQTRKIQILVPERAVQVQVLLSAFSTFLVDLRGYFLFFMLVITNTINFGLHTFNSVVYIMILNELCINRKYKF